jgi:ParB family chromosome partitioning protein
MKAELIEKTKLKPDKSQPRKTFNIEELVASIKEKGVITPLVITPDFKILDGERRWRASQKVDKIKKLPCVIMEEEEYEKPDKRLETQILINEMREDYNVIERAEAYKRYIDAGHSQMDLARLLQTGHTTIQNVLGLLACRQADKERLRKDDTDWTLHARAEMMLNSSIPQKQKERIHQRIFEGAFANKDELDETLEFAKEHPAEREKIIEAKDTTERGLVMIGAERPVPTEYKPKKKASPEDIEKMRFTEMIQALNTINSSRTLWAMSDAIDIVKKLATKEQKKNIIRSIETIVRVWSETLKKLK